MEVKDVTKPRMKCVRCKKAIPVLADKAGDPYCSTLCCKLDHDVDPKQGRFAVLGLLQGQTWMTKARMKAVRKNRLASFGG